MPSRSFTHDAAGNILTDAQGGVTKTYTYSDAGRMASLAVGGAGQGPYLYNGFGQLASRTVTANPTFTLHMLYDRDGNLIAEADGATGEIVREYFWLGMRPVAVMDAAHDGSLHAVHVDHLERPLMMTDFSGAVVWQADYLPFGEVRTSSGAPDLDYRFPGQWFMAETSLHYNWFRWYDATTGRYTQSDPLGMPDGPSRYAYALNSPLTYVDPDGLVRRLNPNSQECRELANKIENITRKMARRLSDMRRNPLKLPFDPPYAGAPNKSSISGHITEQERDRRNLARRQREYDEKCGPPPGPAPAPMSVPPPVSPPSATSCMAVGVGVAVGVAVCVFFPEICAAAAIGAGAAAAGQ